jgi:hypothetical protein
MDNTRALLGFVFGRLWAKRAGATSPAAQNRAGLMLALGGMTPVGVALASAMIRRSRTTTQSVIKADARQADILVVT